MRGKRPDGDRGSCCRHPHAPLIVDADDGPLGALRCEEDGLGREVLIHGTVQVQVVLGEVREAGNIEDDAVNAPVREGVGRNLHGRRVQSLFPHQGQQTMHLRRFRCGEGAGDGHAAGKDLDRSDEPGALAQGGQDRIDEVRGGGLAVGARHAVQGGRTAVLRPAAENCSRQRTHQPAGLIGEVDRHRQLPQQAPAFRIGQHCRGAGGSRRSGEAGTVVACARQRHVQIPRLDLAGIDGESGQHDVRTRIGRPGGFNTRQPGGCQ